MSSKEYGAQPAYPTFPISGTGDLSKFKGMTKKEAFAMAAVQGILASGGLSAGSETVASTSIIVADALCEALAKEAK